jgi:hypothetical protein
VSIAKEGVVAKEVDRIFPVNIFRRKKIKYDE